MIQQQLMSPRLNKDPRLTTAYKLFNENDTGILLVHKTTRAGATTGMAAESINRAEQFLILVPTNKIATKTIVIDAVKYSDVKNAKVIHVPSNHNCLKNAKMCEDYPSLKALPFLPLPNKCDGCENYELCPITEIMRHPNSHGFAMTYHKVVALLLSSIMNTSSEPSMSEQILDIVSGVKNTIFDEVHEIQYGKKTSTVVYNSNINSKRKQFEITKYMALSDDFKDTFNMITKFQAMRVSVGTNIAIHEIKGAAESENYWKLHISKTIKNDFTDIRLNKNADLTKVIVGIYHEIIEITKNKEQYNLEMRDILNLIDMLNIIINDRIVLHAERRDESIIVLMSSVDMIYSKLLKSFTMSIQNKTKRLLLTSATICSYDYSEMFMQGKKPQNVTFGFGGDPMKTNDKMYILADKTKIYAHGKNSYYMRKDEILHNIIHILKAYGNENCIIIALNKKTSLEIEKDLKALKYEHRVTYYKSPDMMGVSSDARIMIAIGVAQKPRNSFDAVTKTRLESDVILEESVHCDTWQAWSRVKDPTGIKESLVFAFGVTEDICKDCVSWGYERTVEIEHIEKELTINRKNHTVYISGQCITIPNVIMCDSFNRMCLEANIYTLNKYIVPIMYKIPLYNILIGEICTILVQKYMNVNKSQLIRDYIFNRFDVHAEQNESSWFKSVSTFDDDLINEHFSGTKTIGSYTLRPGNVVKWICFDVDAHPDKEDTVEQQIKKEQLSDDDCNKLCDYLKMNAISYMLEASGSPHSYHIWVFLVDVEATKAKSFGDTIIKSLGIDCEVFPKQTNITRKGYGNLVKAPLGTHQKHGGLSKIMVDGEWIREFETIEIGIMDISDYIIPKTPVRKCRVKHVVDKLASPTITGIRPCIESALTKSLTGTQGHAMRIAVVREFYNFGLTDKVKLAELFKNQADFNLDKSIVQVESIIKDQYRIWSKQTLLDRCGGFIDCENCINVICKGW